MSTHREQWRDANKCRYVCVMMPFVRDWPQTIKHCDIMTALPTATRRDGRPTFFLKRKVCSGVPAEPMFRVKDIYRNYRGILYKHHSAARDLYDMPEEFRPKWLPQLMRRIARLDKHDPPLPPRQIDVGHVPSLLLVLPSRSGETLTGFFFAVLHADCHQVTRVTMLT
ncbi:hypothetical protein P0D72_14605 [Paraburkholderia sediminicola]|uniref:hypothetical protein n=1 Tax=Paraburkholderia sediminicola TaxID=458836 RepID=UPI0038B6DA36